MAPYLDPVHDNRGSELQIGQKVAYNWSGQMAVGTIIAIDRVARYSGYRPLIRIKPQFPPGAARQAESKIGDPRNVLLLFEDGQEAPKPRTAQESALESLLLEGI